MTDKLVLTSFASLQNDTSATTDLNNNNAAIVTALNNTLSRDGTSPNTMGSSLDMNSNRILNLPTPVNPNEPLRVVDAGTLTAGGSIVVNPLPTGGTTGSVLTKTSNTNYATAWEGTNIPAGGTSGQVLAKTSGSDYAIGWTSLGSSIILSGGFSTTLVVTGTTALTLPVSGTVTALGNTSTGSGNIVLATSPTLTSPVLGNAIATSLVTPLIKPASDSTSAVVITKANGTSILFDVDTLNSRIGINTGGNSPAISVPGLHIHSNTSSVSLLPTPNVGAALRLTQADGVEGVIEIDTFGRNGAFFATRANGVLGSITNIKKDDQICAFDGGGYDGSAYQQGPSVGIYAEEDWAPTTIGSGIRLFGNKVGTQTFLEMARFIPGTTRIGPQDSATPPTQSITVPGVIAGTSNTAGSTLTINGSPGTGTGVGGAIIIRTAPAGGAGTAQNTQVESARFSTSGGFSVGTTSDAGLGCILANVNITANNNILAAGHCTIGTGSAIPAGGTAGFGYQATSTSGFGLYFGSGAPTLTAAQGSLYLRSDGSSTSTRVYVNTNGTTGWTNITTAT